MTEFYTTCEADSIRSYMPAAPIMLAATSFWRLGRRAAFRRQSGEIMEPSLPPHITEVAADSGGFTAATHHGGRYPFSFEAYVAWLRTIPNLTWAALPDLPVERELAPTYENLRERQELTLQYARDLWASPSCNTWDGFRGDPWCWVPTIQGRDIDDYVWMAEQLGQILSSQRFQYDTMASVLAQIADRLEPDVRADTWVTQSWAAHGARYRRIGIGSLCHRQTASEIVAIVRSIADILPNERLHLWGVKMDALEDLWAAGLLDHVVSVDSAAWNKRFAHGIDDQRKSGLSQRDYAWNVAWPAYTATVDEVLARPAPAGFQPLLI